ncbi:MAG: hypothetical protein J6M25_02445 [Prevotella sp.]|nr:hypothetical protein [Prevotella sp.]
MDTNFLRPNKAALTNAQYYSFMTAFGEQLASAGFTAAAIQSRQTALAEQTALIDKYLKIQQGSYLSQEIYNADHRGDMAYGTAHAVVLAWLGREFQPQAEAAEVLNRLFRLYKINTSAQYDEQWGLVGNFLTDIEKPELQTHIQTLGIAQPLQVLRECYTQMKTLIRQRDDEQNGRVKGALAQTRKDCDRAYNAVLDIIEAAALMADDATPYYDFITRWNTALNRYIQQIISKKGGSSSSGVGTITTGGGTTDDNENQNENENGGGSSSDGGSGSSDGGSDNSGSTDNGGSTGGDSDSDSGSSSGGSNDGGYNFG